MTDVESTGNEQLDADIRSLHSLDQSTLDRARVLASADNVDFAALLQVLGEGALRAAVTLAPAESLKELKTRFESGHAALDRAHELVERELPFFVNEAVQQQFLELFILESLREAIYLRDSVGRIISTPSLVGHPGQLVPIGTFEFYNRHDELLMKTGMTWADSMFVVATMIQHLLADVRRYSSLAELRDGRTQLCLFPHRLLNHLNRLTEAMKSLMAELHDHYGFGDDEEVAESEKGATEE